MAHAAGQRLYAGPFIMMGHTLRFYYSCPSYECKSSMSLCVLVLLSVLAPAGKYLMVIQLVPV